MKNPPNVGHSRTHDCNDAFASLQWLAVTDSAIFNMEGARSFET